MDNLNVIASFLKSFLAFFSTLQGLQDLPNQHSAIRVGTEICQLGENIADRFENLRPLLIQLGHVITICETAIKENQSDSESVSTQLARQKVNINYYVSTLIFALDPW